MTEPLSTRANTLNGGKESLVPHYMPVTNNIYDATNNPTGICNMGVAENELCREEMIERLKSVQDCLTTIFSYGHPVGELVFRQVLCEFLQEFFHVKNQKLQPERMIITGGAACAFLVYAYLLTDPNDCILIPAPYYTMIDHHVAVFTENKIIRCGLLEQDSGRFRFSVEIFKDGYNKGITKGYRPRMIILINPHNPLGDVYDEETIRSILEFAAEKQMHVVVDEIYALSLFTDQKPFQSILNFFVNHPNHTHFLWSFSKDFTLSGFRVGVMYTGSSELCARACEFNFLLAPSQHIQAILTTLLGDRRWIRSFIDLNRSKLTHRYRYVKAQLESMNVRVRESHAGFFIWIDLRSFMRDITFDEENRLFEYLLECGVFITPGYTFGSSQPGWFRLVFTGKDTHINEGLARMRKALEEFTRRS